MKPLFQHRPSNTVKLVLCIAVSAAMMTFDHRFDQLRSVRAALGTAVYPLQYISDLPARIGYWTTDNLASRRRLINENEALRAEHLRLRAQMQTFGALEHENQRLRQLLKSTSHIRTNRMLIAELLSVDMDPFKQQIILNKGSLDGAYVGQPLLDASGVMGQIISVTPFTSIAILISDPSHALPVQIKRNGVRTVAVGKGNTDRLSLRHIPMTVDIREGDEVSTSGLGQRYPADYPVGRVTEVIRNPGEAFVQVEVRPSAQLDRGREVLLIWPYTNPPENMPNQQVGR
ncbi:MAG: rod shape-determining protein MreC [Gammaproteobacteria bacterium]